MTQHYDYAPALAGAHTHAVGFLLLVSTACWPSPMVQLARRLQRRRPYGVKRNAGPGAGRASAPGVLCRRLTAPICDQEILTGRPEDVLRRLDELLQLNVSAGIEVASASRELRPPDCPIAALQQLVRNAVMHRSYEGTNTPVRVYWYGDYLQCEWLSGYFTYARASSRWLSCHPRTVTANR